MELRFEKYHGHGNDFIVLDGRSLERDLTQDEIHHICTRRYGVGGDGLMLVLDSKSHSFDMEYYNANGLKGSMCGNGGRCIVHFAAQLGLVPKDELFTFAAHGDTYQAKVVGDLVHLHFPTIPDSVVKEYSSLSGYVFTGSPHHVEIVKQLDRYPVTSEGEEIRHSELYHPHGTNVNFIEITSSNSLNIRTFERGVEQETHACGTGTVASVIWAHQQGQITDNHIFIRALGGDLEVLFDYTDHTYSNIVYSGRVHNPFSGQITV